MAGSVYDYDKMMAHFDELWYGILKAEGEIGCIEDAISSIQNGMDPDLAFSTEFNDSHFTIVEDCESNIRGIMRDCMDISFSRTNDNIETLWRDIIENMTALISAIRYCRTVSTELAEHCETYLRNDFEHMWEDANKLCRIETTIDDSEPCPWSYDDIYNASYNKDVYDLLTKMSPLVPDQLKACCYYQNFPTCPYRHWLQVDYDMHGKSCMECSNSCEPYRVLERTVDIGKAYEELEQWIESHKWHNVRRRTDEKY